MAQRSVEILIGRLTTDEAFRTAYLTHPVAVLAEFTDQGHELTAVEVDAIVSTPAESWVRLAGAIDPRLQRAILVPRITGEQK